MRKEKIMSHYDYTNINKRITELTGICKKNYNINPELYNKYEVKRGLRDINGKRFGWIDI